MDMQNIAPEKLFGIFLKDEIVWLLHRGVFL